VLKKGKKDSNVLFIDATNECIKVTNNNKLTPENLDNIVAEYTSREDKEHFARLVSYDDVRDNDYNLSVSTYVEAEDTREVIDIVELNAQIEEIVARENVLREEISKIIAEIKK
jgi:type I restriction enzyme M protein